ncbi:MAG: Fic family protein [Candidatus Thermoplasmatota archaeon]|nr:Fic family protein [Candidatus Thermoplasmatota archaeon]
MKYADTDIVINDSFLDKIEKKKEKLDSLRPLPKDAVKRIIEDIRLRHTYHSDAIEGNTLTLQETKLVLEEGVTIGGKPLKDHIEARNDAEAFDLMIELVNSKKNISQEIIQQIHEFVMNGILKNPGQYRTENVAIAGAKIRPPSYLKIVNLMDEYIQNIEKLKLKTIKKAAFIHHEFVRIHPFIDGNGRVARLLTNFYLMRNGYPPIVIQKEDRKKYYKTLNKADQGDLSDFATFISRAVNESLQYYLSSFIDEERLLTLSELSKKSDYSQEYLSFRARQGKLDAVKIENIWYSSKRSLKDYQKNIKK